MANNISIKITNLDRIKYAFGVAPHEMTKQLNMAIKKSILTIQADSMRNTPVATGRLRASTRSLFGDLKGEVGTNTNYDVFVHNGTRFMPARPYLKDAVEDNNFLVNQFMTGAVQNTLDKIAGLV